MSRLIEDLSTDDVEPGHEVVESFDFDAVEMALGNEPLTAEDKHKLAFALSFILDWVLDGDLGHRSALRRIGKRTITMAWVMCPERFGDNASLRSLSKQLGFSAPNISPIAAACSKHFKISNQFQVHDWRNKPHEHS